MLIDIISRDNYFCYNIKLAKILGLHTAIYISDLLVQQNNELKINKESVYFNINRDKVSDHTTLSVEEQKICDKNLIQLNVLEFKENSDTEAKIDVVKLTNLVATDDERVLKKATKVVIGNTKSAGKMSNRQKQFNELKTKIICQNDELRQAYEDWIDGVYANPKGFLSFKSVNVFQKTVDDFAQGDLDLALKIIEIAAINGYRDATWAINLFHKDYEKDFMKARSQSIKKTVRNVSLSSEVF